MKIRIYQINLDRDTKGVAFEPLGFMETHGVLDSSIYDKVFDGDVVAEEPEDVYRLFNIDLDAQDGYHGRSLSVSDVVEVCESDTTEPGFYFCDAIGFKKVDFDPEKTGIADIVTVMVYSPAEDPYLVRIDNAIQSFQEVVDGYIEVVYPFSDMKVALVVNEEGKIMKLPPNRRLTRKDTKEVVDAAVGTIMFVGFDDETGDFVSLTGEQIDKIRERVTISTIWMQ